MTTLTNAASTCYSTSSPTSTICFLLYLDAGFSELICFWATLGGDAPYFSLLDCSIRADHAAVTPGSSKRQYTWLLEELVWDT